MKIVLCVKAVPSKLVYSNEVREDKLTMNPYDLLALEKLLALKKNADISITCVCMGALEAKSVLVHCLAMGANDAVLLNDFRFAGSDTYATTHTLCAAMRKIDYDAIVCGAQAVDGETGQVGYGLAERLNLFCVSDVLEIADVCGSYITVEAKKVNCIQTLEFKLPAVISFCDFNTDSGEISLSALKRSQKKPIAIWTAENLGLDINMCGQAGSKTKVLQTSSVLDRRNVQFLEGTEDENIQFFSEQIATYSQNI